MNAALLSSIYQKNNECTHLESSTYAYIKDLFVIYLNVCNDFNIDNSNKFLVLKKTQSNGKTKTQKIKCSKYITNIMFSDETYKNAIFKADQSFCLDNNTTDIIKVMKKIKKNFVKYMQNCNEKTNVLQNLYHQISNTVV